MKLRAEHVFAVRNRKQEENDQALPLTRARELETQCIRANEELAQSAEMRGYGLGVSELCKRLVEIQRQRIIETLPSTAKAIRCKLDDLQHRLAEIGLPMDDEQACKLKAMSLADDCHEMICREQEGRAQEGAGAPTSVSKLIELELRIEDDFVAATTTDKKLSSETIEMADGLSAVLDVYPTGGAYVRLTELPAGVNTVSAHLTIEARLDNAQESLVTRSDFNTFGEAMGWDMGWDNLHVPSEIRIERPNGDSIVFRARLFVKRYEMQEGKAPVRLWCATINELGEKFVKEMHKVQPDHKFFSQEFGMMLGAAARDRSGSNCMPGAINHEVPIGVLGNLRKGLPPVVTSYVQAFSDAAADKIKAITSSCIDSKMHPKLLRLLQLASSTVLEVQTELALKEAMRKLVYENVIHTSNHYYMDLVQELRKLILSDPRSNPRSTKPSHLQHLDFEILKKKSNAEQEIVDLQIKTHAYWHVMMKRLVDEFQSIIRTVLSIELVGSLRAAFRKAIEDEENMTALMAPDDALGRERSSLAIRIANLKEADRLLKEHERNIDISAYSG